MHSFNKYLLNMACFTVAMALTIALGLQVS